MPSLPRWLQRRPWDKIAAGVAAMAAVAILINALFLQSGPHPAPIFANKPPTQPAPAADPRASLLSRRSLAEAKVDAAPKAHPRSDMIADMQRELSRRGFYDGPVDGIYGPKTDGAIRDFEQAAGLRPAAEPNDVLLAAIRRSNVTAPPPARRDPIAELLAPSKRLIAIQRALSDFGYGPLNPTGVYDAQTRAAIERFERARRRSATGQITEQLVRELSALTGRPLE